MAFFSHSLLFFSALVRRCKGWHSLIADSLLWEEPAHFYAALNQVPFLPHPRTSPPHQHGQVPAAPGTMLPLEKQRISEHPGSGEDGKWGEGWSAGCPFWPSSAITHRALVLVIADVLDGSDVDDVDALLLSRQTGVLLIHPHSCLLWSLAEIFWQKIHPMKLAVCVWEGREQFYQDSLIPTLAPPRATQKLKCILFLPSPVNETLAGLPPLLLSSLLCIPQPSSALPGSSPPPEEECSDKFLSYTG